MITDTILPIAAKREHFTEMELIQIYEMGLGEQFENAMSAHLQSCLECRVLNLRVRDSFSEYGNAFAAMTAPPVKMKHIRDSLTKKLAAVYGDDEVKNHPVLRFVSDDTYVTRLEHSGPRLTAALVSRVAFECGSRSSGSLLIKSGEFNVAMYETLRDMYYFNQIVDQLPQPISIEFIGGPDISVRPHSASGNPAPVPGNYVFELVQSFQDRIRLYLRTNDRERYHYVVHSDDSSIAVCDDFHTPLSDRGTTIIYNGSSICDALRSDFEKTKSYPEVCEWDRSEGMLEGRLRIVG